MPKYVLTGVGGKLGSIAAAYCLQIAQPQDELVFTSHDLSAVPSDLRAIVAARGIEILFATYNDQRSLEKAFVGAQAVAMISTWDLGVRPSQARNVINAAKACEVQRICYTSFVGADSLTEEMPFLPRDHHEIERLIYASGLDYNIQRNNLYIDNIPLLFAPSWRFCGDSWLSNSHGVPGAYVAREDCGRVLGALLLGHAKPNTVVHVTGPEAVTDKQIFEFICQQTGYQGEFRDVPDEELQKFWTERGLPTEFWGDFSHLPMKLTLDDLLCCGEIVAKGYMATPSSDVERLTGRKALDFRTVLAKYQEELTTMLSIS